MPHKFKITGGRCIKTPLGVWASLFDVWTCEKCGIKQYVSLGEPQDTPPVTDPAKTFIIEEIDEHGEVFTYTMCGELTDAEQFVKEHEENSARWKLNLRYSIKPQSY